MHADRRGHRPPRAARLLGGRGRRRDPGAAADRRVSALRGRAAKPDSWPAAAAPVAPVEPREQARGSTSSTTSSSARAPFAGPASTPACCGCARRCAALPSRSQGPRPPSATRSRPASRRCSAPRATSPARAASRSASPTASTSAIPRSRRSRCELAQAIEGIAQAAKALGIPVVSGNVSLYNDTDGRPIPPTPVVGCVGLVPDVRNIPSSWGPATSCCSPRRPRLARRRGGADPVPLEGGAAPDALPRRRPRRARARARRGGRVERPRGGRRRAAADGRRRDPRVRARGRREARLEGLRRDRAGALACAGSSASTLPTATSRGSRTSGSSRSSTGARSRPGSPSPTQGRLTALRDLGLVTQVFDEQKLHGLHGPGRDRAHALLDDRLVAVVERAAARAPRRAPARSRSATTATSSTPRRCAPSCATPASRCARPPTAR